MTTTTGFGFVAVFWIVALLIFWVAPIIVTGYWGNQRGQQYAWLWGLLLGWVGLLGVLLVGDKNQPTGGQFTMSYQPQPPAPSEAMKACPRCAEPVRAQAKVCRYCGHEFETPDSPV